MRSLPSGTPVRIRAPRDLRGTTGTVLRPADGGYEVGYFTSGGFPMHVVLKPRHLAVLT